MNYKVEKKIICKETGEELKVGDEITIGTEKYVVSEENGVRTITLTNIEEKDNKLVITFKGDGFLRYQVRNMVGILIKIGENKISPSKVKEILER